MSILVNIFQNLGDDVVPNLQSFLPLKKKKEKEKREEEDIRVVVYKTAFFQNQKNTNTIIQVMFLG